MVRNCTLSTLVLIFLFFLTSESLLAQACSCTVSQGSTSIPLSTFVGTTDVVTWLDYDANMQASFNTGLEQPNTLIATLYEDNNGQVSLVIMLDQQDDGDGGTESLTVSCLPDGSFVSFSNETGEATGAAPTVTGNFSWGPPNNDGVAISGVTCPMTVTIDAGYADGISGAAVVDGMVGAPNIVGLPGTGTITINCGGSACCPAPIVNDVNIINSSCPNSTDGSIVINESTLAGLPPFTYIWDDFNGFGNQISGVGAGTYCVTVIDAQGCEETNCYQIFASFPAPIANPAGPLFGCGDITGQALFDLTTLNNTVNGGFGAQVFWYEDDFLINQIPNPEGYFSFGFFPVYAVVFNGQCFSDPVEVTLNVEPTPFASPAMLMECEVMNGEAVFDLTESEDDISGGFGITTWYEDMALNNVISDPTSYTSTTTTIYATVLDDMTMGMCESEPVELMLIVNPAPTGMSDTLMSCTDGNGMGTFNLSTATSTVNTSNGSLNWFEDDMQMTAIGADSTAYVTGNDTVYAFITLNGCVSEGIPVYLSLIEVMPGPSDNIYLCDDGAGFATFDLSLIESTLLGSSDSLQWYEDTLASMQIADPTAYNTDSTTVFYVLYESGCVSPSSPVDLYPLPTPLVQTDTLSSCDEGDGTGVYDLNTAMIITNGIGSVSWFEDAAGMLPIANTTNYNTLPTTIYAQATEDTCSSPLVPVVLDLIAAVTATSDTIELCGDGSGIATFDLTSINADVSSGTGTVNWYEDMAGTMTIADPANYTTTSTTVYADVTAGSCSSGIVPILLTVIPLPVATPVNLQECEAPGNVATFDLTAVESTISGGNGIVNWYTDNQLMNTIAAPGSFMIDADSIIFVTVSDTACTSLSVAVTLDLLELPATMPDTLINCDNGNGTAPFDLTTANVTSDPGATVTWYQDMDTTMVISNTTGYMSAGETVYAVVNDGNCNSLPVAVELQTIFAQAPDLYCAVTSIDSVGFAWDVVADSFSVTYQINNGPVMGPVIVTDTTFGVGGLSEGDLLSIEVTSLIDPLCTAGITSIESCTADACQPIQFTFDNLLSEYCSDELPFLLMATPSGGSFSGAGISNDTLYPGMLSGSSLVFYDYLDPSTSCLYRDSMEITVFDPLQAVTIACSNITVNDITFSWNDVGASEYQIDLIVGGVPSPSVNTGNLDTTLTGLAAETEVMITVTPIGPLPCGNGPSSSETCTTDPCPPTNLSPDFLATEYCSDTSGIALPDIYPGGVYAGPGINGTQFDPDMVGMPSAIISFSYTDTMTGCPYILEDTVNLIEPLLPPAINCDSVSPNSVTFTWSGGNPDGYQYYYQVENNTPSAVTTTMDSSLYIGGLNETENVTLYILSIGQDPCGNSTYDSLDCASSPCPLMNITLNNLDTTYCIDDAAFTLDINPVGGTFTGNGIIGNDFDPALAGVGPVTIMYDYTDTLIDCSYSATFITEVFDTLVPPTITCDLSTPSSVSFSWNDVGATAYLLEWTIDNVPAGDSLLTGTSFDIIDLLPEQVVGITLTAQGPAPCGNATPSTAECSSSPCPAISFDFTAPSPVCSEDGTIQLDVNVIGSSPTGQVTWSGDGIIDDSGTFDPTILLGDNSININYADGVCSYDTSVTVYVHPEPVASFTVDGSFCSDSTLILTYNGMSTDSATLNWLLDGGTIVQENNNVLEVSWPVSGNYTPALVIEDNGCISDTFNVPVELIAPMIPPVISCQALNYTSIEFSWPSVAGADSYDVMTSNGTGTLVGTTYTVTGLMPGDAATVTVTAIGTTPCGPVTSELSCNTDPCPDISFEFTAPSPVCSEDGNILLTTNIIGSSPAGTTTWSGDGIINANGTFDPTQAIVGDNMVTITYDEEGVCTFDSTFIVYVHPQPEASFTVDGSFCSDSTLIITFDGIATDSATLNWDLDGGTIVQENNNVLEVSWPTAGSYNISLTIADNGCDSETFTVPVELIPPMIPPLISCDATNNTTIVFSWDSVVGADSYQVTTTNGTGVLSGTTYTVSGLLPEESTTVSVTAIGSTPCGNVTSELECSTPPCPEVVLAINAPANICSGEDVSLTFDINGVGGTFEVEYQVNGGATQTASLADGDELNFTNLTADFMIEIISYYASANDACIYPGGQMVETAVMTPPVSGAQSITPSLCLGTDSLIQLINLLSGADAGGSWTLNSPASAPGFDATNGTLSTVNLPTGGYEFVYTVSGNGICPDARTFVNVNINTPPSVDAGEGQEISCNMGMVSLGSGSNPTGSGISYLWTSETPGVIINNPTAEFIDVSQPGTYTLSITNAAGCSSSDDVQVTANLDAPIGFYTATPPSCFGITDALINIDSIIGGEAPYNIYLNDVAQGNQTAFFNLLPGDYTVVIEGANGCMTEQMFSLPEPPELTASITATLENDESLIFGDSTLISVITNNVVPIDTFIWQPNGSGQSFWASPQSTATYTVTVVDENGCTAEDEILIIVEKVRDVFVPNIFSPNDDGRNDIFYIQSGGQVANVKSFQIFNRWGESVYETFNFQPNDPNYGWDGEFRGEKLNPAVFVWFAEVEFIDGEVLLLKGDVTLLR